MLTQLPRSPTSARRRGWTNLGIVKNEVSPQKRCGRRPYCEGDRKESLGEIAHRGLSYSLVALVVSVVVLMQQLVYDHGGGRNAWSSVKESPVLLSRNTSTTDTEGDLFEPACSRTRLVVLWIRIRPCVAELSAQADENVAPKRIPPLPHDLGGTRRR
ncbi:hypothetical protein BD413DRAFT_309734 [Trametes elegans]|nr:hypothetical protein BD413DRAFT_309734 [Trametes elegans]